MKREVLQCAKILKSFQHPQLDMTSIDQRRFRRLILNAIVLPLVLLVALASVLVLRIDALVMAGQSIEHSDLVLAHLNKLERNYIDMETGLRGFLLSQNDSFLAPLNDGITSTKPVEENAAELLKGEPEILEVLSQIRRVKERWLAYASEEISARKSGLPSERSQEASGIGKQQMDHIRELFAQIIGEEEQARVAKSQRAERAVPQTLWTCGGLMVVIGATLALFSKRQLEDLSATYNSALNVSTELAANLEQRVLERTSELKSANASLDEANKELEAFSYSISHDLRAPLRHISGFAGLLLNSKESTVSGEDQENLAIIASTAQTAGHMVDSLLAFSRVGRVQLRTNEVDMQKLFEEAKKELISETGAKNVAWHIGTLPTASGDASLLRLVVQNLVSNAIKYSSNTTNATIEVGGHIGENMVTYFVKDNGVGFDMTYVHKLFGVFQRLHRAEEFEGTGIGLANMRRIVQRHGGTVWAESELGKGATFSFTLFKAAIGP